MLRRAYSRLGPRYPRLAVVLVPQLALLNVALGIVVLAFFVDMSAWEFARILLVALGLMSIYNLVYARLALRCLEPLGPWLEGKRDPAATVTAGQSCASFPREMMRREWLSPLLGGASYAGLFLWALYATWQLDLPAYTAIPLFLAIMVQILYVQALRFFAPQLGVLRPMPTSFGRIALTTLARWVLATAQSQTAGLALRAR